MSAFNSPYRYHSYGLPAQFDSPNLIRPPVAALHIHTYSPAPSGSSQHKPPRQRRKEKEVTKTPTFSKVCLSEKSGAQPFPSRRRLLSCSRPFQGKPTGPFRNSRPEILDWLSEKRWWSSFFLWWSRQAPDIFGQRNPISFDGRGFVSRDVHYLDRRKRWKWFSWRPRKFSIYSPPRIVAVRERRATYWRREWTQPICWWALRNDLPQMFNRCASSKSTNPWSEVSIW